MTSAAWRRRYRGKQLGAVPTPAGWLPGRAVAGRTVDGRIAWLGVVRVSSVDRLLGTRNAPHARRHVRFKTEETSHDLQSLGDPLRVAPERVVDKTVEQIRRQQRVARFGLDGGAHGVQPGVPARSSNPVTS